MRVKGNSQLAKNFVLVPSTPIPATIVGHSVTVGHLQSSYGTPSANSKVFTGIWHLSQRYRGLVWNLPAELATFSPTCYDKCFVVFLFCWCCTCDIHSAFYHQCAHSFTSMFVNVLLSSAFALPLNIPNNVAVLHQASLSRHQQNNISEQYR